jgi:transaldolase
MPLETIHAFQDHGEVRGDTVLEGVDEARDLLARIEEAGVSYDEIVETIEAEGVQKFADSYDEIVESVRAKRGSLAAA